jgi:uncharacterized membrane protein/protein-disulfide isomerase
MTPLRRKLLLAFAILGLGASIASTYVHYKLLTDPGYTSFCDVNPSASCTQAYLSPYGSLLGVPVALAGVLFFALVLLLAGPGADRESSAHESAPSYTFALSVIGLAVVLYLGWASWFQLHTFCLLCATTYVAVIAIVIISGGATRVPVAALPGRAVRDLRALATSPMALMAVLAVMAGTGMVAASFPRERAQLVQAPLFPPLTDQQRADIEKWWAVQPKTDLPIPNEGAKIVIVKFSDYMCPACRETYEWYKPILDKYVASGQVRYVVKHYPLEAECNPSAPSNHYASCEAAAAVIMARPKGTAPQLEQWIFSNQPSLTPDSVKRAASAIGGIQDFDAEYPRALEEVKADASLGGRLGITSTPTFYIDGRRVPGETITPPPYFDFLIEVALKEAK